MNTRSNELANPTQLYRLWGADGKLLYVGVAGNPGRRFQQHRGEKPWWGDVRSVTLEHFPTRQAAVAAELKAIRKEHPLHNVSGAVPGKAIEVEPPPPAGPQWQFYGRRWDSLIHGEFTFYWELNGSTFSDDFEPSEADAYDMWVRYVDYLHRHGGWSRSLGEPYIGIYWGVEVDGQMRDGKHYHNFESAPFQVNPWLHHDFLTYFSWPQHRITGEDLNWLQVTVRDGHWTPDWCTKAGFVQEATGWKPTPLQPVIHLEMLAKAAGLPWK